MFGATSGRPLEGGQMSVRDPNTKLEQRLWRLQAGDHLCFLYESAEDHRALVAPFMRQGLERHEKILYILDDHTAGQILEYLSADGIGVKQYLQRGQLSILGSAEIHRQAGGFEPERMIALLRSETDRAAAEGYIALRVSGEMSWALKGPPGSERIVEFEARLNTFFPGSKCLAICQYDRRRFDPGVLLDVLATHPLAVIAREVYDNFYYMPPQDFFGAHPVAAKLDSWLNHLKERKRSETQIRTLTQKLMKTQENERRMISRELHDRVGQDLSGIKVSLETLFDPQPAESHEIKEKVTRLASLLDHTIFTVRDLAYDLRPPGLEEMGIVQALAMFCNDFSEKTRIHTDFHSVGIEKMKLDFNTQINLYRMIQEGLNNIHKHAEATRAVVKLTAAYPHIILRIEDNGKGFDVEKRAREMDSEKRMGLRSLQERTHLLGGVMIVTSKPGQGTKILIKLPYAG
jgi:signal transduction histidine kinase